MRILKSYLLFEKLNPQQDEQAKARIKTRVEELFKDLMNRSTIKNLTIWVKDEAGLDLNIIVDDIKNLIIKSGTEQWPNIKQGLKGEEYAKYIECQIGKIYNQSISKYLSGAKGWAKKKFIKAKYFKSGKQGFIKELLDQVLNKKGSSEDMKDSIDSFVQLTRMIMYASTPISQGARVIPDGGSNEYPEIQSISSLIRKWDDSYSDYFDNNIETIYTNWLNSIANAIWD